MDNKRQIEFPGKFNLLNENISLFFFRGVCIVIIQPCFSNGDDFSGIFQSFYKVKRVRTQRSLRVMGMHARGKIKRIFFQESRCLCETVFLIPAADGYYGLEPRLFSPFHDLIPVRVKPWVVKVGMGIYEKVFFHVLNNKSPLEGLPLRVPPPPSPPLSRPAAHR